MKPPTMFDLICATTACGVAAAYISVCLELGQALLFWLWV